MTVERLPGVLDELGQRMGEVAIPTVPETMPRHVDRRAKPISIEHVRDLAALAFLQNPIGNGEPAPVQLVTQTTPIQFMHALDERGSGRSDRGHGHETPPALAA